HRLADRADRGDGRPGRRQHPAPPRARRGRGPRDPPPGTDHRVRGPPGEPVHRGRTRLYRRRHQAQRDPRRDRPRPPPPPHQTRHPAPEEAWEHPAMTTIKIAKGNPTPEELAALVAVVAARAAVPAPA